MGTNSIEETADTRKNIYKLHSGKGSFFEKDAKEMWMSCRKHYDFYG